MRGLSAVEIVEREEGLRVLGTASGVVIDVGSAGVVIDVGSAGIHVESRRDGLFLELSSDGWLVDDGVTTTSDDAVWFEPDTATPANVTIGGQAGHLDIDGVVLDRLSLEGSFASLQMDSSGLGELLVSTTASGSASEIHALRLRGCAVEHFVNYGDITSLFTQDTSFDLFENFGTITHGAPAQTSIIML